MREAEHRSRQFARRLRKEMTDAEVVLWTFLRRRALNGCKFRRQHPIGPYIADFAGISERLVIEVDGATHRTAQELEHDALLTAYMEKRGWRIVRVTNQDVFENMDGVWRTVAHRLPPLAASPPASPASGGGNWSAS